MTTTPKQNFTGVFFFLCTTASLTVHQNKMVLNERTTVQDETSVLMDPPTTVQYTGAESGSELFEVGKPKVLFLKSGAHNFY